MLPTERSLDQVVGQWGWVDGQGMLCSIVIEDTRCGFLLCIEHVIFDTAALANFIEAKQHSPENANSCSTGDHAGNFG